MTDWIVSQITSFCSKYPRRLAGSASCKAASDDMASQLEAWIDSVRKEPFSMHPTAFMGSITVQCIAALLAIGLLWAGIWYASFWLKILTVVLLLLWFVSWMGEYWLYLRIFDWLHRKAIGQNVYAERKAAGESRRKVIVAGHVDAAYEMRFFRGLPTWAVGSHIVVADGGLSFLLVCSILNCLGLTSPVFYQALAIIGIAVACSLVGWLCFVNWRVVSPGACDDLTGCFIAMSLLKEMAEKGIRLQHTDVGVLITDGEECGCRGAMAFAKAHRQELLESNAIIISADTFRNLENMCVYGRGINGTNQDSKEVCELMRTAAEKLGRDLPYAGWYPGATDADPFSRQGIKAAAICAMSHGSNPYYHTRDDSPENLIPEAITAGREVLWQVLEELDS